MHTMVHGMQADAGLPAACPIVPSSGKYRVERPCPSPVGAGTGEHRGEEAANLSIADLPQSYSAFPLSPLPQTPTPHFSYPSRSISFAICAEIAEESVRTTTRTN